ncbi:MAG: DUF3291 domain-containing protein [Rhodobacteraceae bacterium]|nr:DUF3291 domain-containing protein [Paracoccaceae bacterium]
MPLAEFNKGVLKHDWEDPRIADFADNIDFVNGVAQRADGFIWMLDEEGMEAAQLEKEGVLGGNPRTASTLSVWRDLAALEHFVWNTVHKRFYDRRAEWYDPTDELRMVLWWVPDGHLPSVTEAMERFAHLEQNGDSDFAFGWQFAKAQARNAKRN